MKTKLKILSVSALLALSSAGYADTDLFGGKVKAGGYFAQAWQTAFEVKGAALTAADTQADSGFSRLRFGMWFAGEIAEDFSFYVELAEEPNDQGDGNYQITQDLAFIDYKINDALTFRVGNVVETTMNFIRYSDGGSVQGNPLAGNGGVDMITAAEGVWLTGAQKVSLGTWDYNATITKPSFFGDASVESGYNFGLRSTIVTDSGFGLGGGIFKTTGDAINCSAAGTGCKLSDGGGIGDLIGVGDGDNYDFGSKTLNARRTMAGVLPGIDATIWQLDLMWSGDALGKPVTIHGTYGQGEDNYSFTSGSFATNTASTFNSTVDAEQEFWRIFGRVDLTDTVYIATRYSVSNNETANRGVGDNELNRLQVGAGWWVRDSVLIKAEYVDQEEGSVSGGGRCKFGAGDCSWDGFVLEGSVSF